MLFKRKIQDFVSRKRGLRIPKRGAELFAFAAAFPASHFPVARPSTTITMWLAFSSCGSEPDLFSHAKKGGSKTRILFPPYHLPFFPPYILSFAVPDLPPYILPRIFLHPPFLRSSVVAIYMSYSVLS